MYSKASKYNAVVQVFTSELSEISFGPGNESAKEILDKGVDKIKPKAWFKSSK